MSQIDWSVELRKIEREYDGLPPAPSPARLRAERALKEQREARASALADLFGAWARLLLVAALAASLAWGPYGRDCGRGLAGFLGACGTVALGGLWTAVLAWQRRLALAHVVAVTLLVGGLVLLAGESLPRLGYATFPWVPSVAWRCLAA